MLTLYSSASFSIPSDFLVSRNTLLFNLCRLKTSKVTTKNKLFCQRPLSCFWDIWKIKFICRLLLPDTPKRDYTVFQSGVRIFPERNIWLHIYLLSWRPYVCNQIRFLQPSDSTDDKFRAFINFLETCSNQRQYFKISLNIQPTLKYFTWRVQILIGSIYYAANDVLCGKPFLTSAMQFD